MHGWQCARARLPRRCEALTPVATPQPLAIMRCAVADLGRQGRPQKSLARCQPNSRSIPSDDSGRIAATPARSPGSASSMGHHPARGSRLEPGSIHWWSTPYIASLSGTVPITGARQRRTSSSPYTARAAAASCVDNGRITSRSVSIRGPLTPSRWCRLGGPCMPAHLTFGSAEVLSDWSAALR